MMPTVEVKPEDNRFAKFDSVTNYMILETYEIGGSNPQFWKGEFTHTPEYAVVQFCQVQEVDQPFGAGHAILIGFDPWYRMWTMQEERLVLNGVLYPAGSAIPAS